MTVLLGVLLGDGEIATCRLVILSEVEGSHYIIQGDSSIALRSTQNDNFYMRGIVR